MCRSLVAVVEWVMAAEHPAERSHPFNQQAVEEPPRSQGRAS
jgi:hypothetical protein